MNDDNSSIGTVGFKRALGRPVDTRPFKRMSFRIGPSTTDNNTPLMGGYVNNFVLSADVGEEIVRATRKFNRPIVKQIETTSNPGNGDKYWVPGTILFGQREVKDTIRLVTRYPSILTRYSRVNMSTFTFM